VQVIGLSGYARTGKDTIAAILVEQHGYQRIAFADQLRELTLRIDPYVTTAGTRLSTVIGQYGWERAKDTFPEVRRLLQVTGVSVRDVVDEEAWVEALQRRLRPDRNYVIPDVRFPNELMAVRQMDGLTVRVTRPGYGPVNDHVSETALDDYTFDMTVDNYGPRAYLRGVAVDLTVEAARKGGA